MPDEQNIYYHYTSVEALYNIVKTRTFWLVNSKSSNDKTEGVLDLNKFKEILEKTYEKTPDGKQDFFKNIIDFPFSLDNRSVCNEYILSLSSQKDSLAHWERYGNGKNGISICLNIQRLERFYNQLNWSFGALFRIHSLIYDYDDFVEQILLIIEKDWSVPELSKLFENPLDDMNFLIKTVKTGLYNALCSFKKNPYFKDEKELRIACQPSEITGLYGFFKALGKQFKTQRAECIRNAKSLDIEKPYFEPIRGEIRSLHHLCLKDIWGSDLIPEIMLGPNCPQSKDELRYFLDENGLTGTKITESEIPIR